MDYFNTKERKQQHSFALLRDHLFSPLVQFMVWLGITPNQLSILGVIFLFFAAIIPPSQVWFITFCIFLYILFDGIDGPLARSIGSDHDGGSIVDMVVDHMGIIVLSAA
ncbi:CDP-alcohol phosphatidyltransferase, partial [Achromatium sp. WMS1]